MGIEKAFDPLDHDFLILTLEKNGSYKIFILWVKMLVRDQGSSFINGGTTTEYFSLGRGAHQGGPISTFLYILALVILFILIKLKPEMRPADDKTFFLKDIISLKHMVDTFIFFVLFRIKIKFSKI